MDVCWFLADYKALLKADLHNRGHMQMILGVSFFHSRCCCIGCDGMRTDELVSGSGSDCGGIWMEVDGHECKYTLPWGELTGGDMWRAVWRGWRRHSGLSRPSPRRTLHRTSGVDWRTQSPQTQTGQYGWPFSWRNRRRTKRKKIEWKSNQFYKIGKDNVTGSGLESETSGLPYQCSSIWAIQPLDGGPPE